MANLSLTQPLKFDSIDLKEEEVTICGKKFVIRQARSKDGELFRNKQAQCAKSRMTDGELTGMEIDGIGGVQPFLVSLLLKEVRDDGTRADVPIGTVNCWPDPMVTAIFNRCIEISPSLKEAPTRESLLREKARIERALSKMEDKEDSAKNSQSGTTAGSA